MYVLVSPMPRISQISIECVTYLENQLLIAVTLLWPQYTLACVQRASVITGVSLTTFARGRRCWCSGAVYLFRLVAVYSNDDNKHGRNSDRFFLSSSLPARSRGPSSAPLIVDVQPVSDTAISVRWQVPE